MKNGSDPVTVLVVDDDAGIRQGSKRIIDRMGCRTVTADCGEGALELLKTETVSIVLLELKLPDIDGMEVLRIVGETNPRVPVIAMTGSATVEAATKAMKNGAFDFIPKPFEPDQLQTVINGAREKPRLPDGDRERRPQNETGPTDRGMEKTRIHTIVNTLPTGLLVTDAQGRVVLVNPAFMRQTGFDGDTALDRPVEAYISDEGLCSLILEISRGCHVDDNDIPDYEFSPDNDRFFMARGRPVVGDKHDCLGAVVTFEDITALKVIERLKSEFVSKVSHELRSPLSTIHEQLAAVLSDMAGRGSRPEAHLLSRAKEKTQGLISLIGDLLDLSRIESGAVCEAPKPVVLEELLANIIDFLGARAAAKQQTLTLVQPREPLPAITADPLALESIFGNLITNAINYTPENGSIEVRISRTGIHLKVQVADNGLGMESRHLERIFERFYRVKTENTRYITGTGLGLPIVKGLVDALGGVIRVESAPEEGSTFTVLLPADTANMP